MHPGTDRDPREQFAAAFERETQITLRVLRAFPDDKLDLKPHPRLKSARDLAWLLVREQSMLQTALGPGFDWSRKQEPFPEPPRTMREIADALEAGLRLTLATLRQGDDVQLQRPVSWFTGPGAMGDVSMNQFLWFMLHDQIHHRGQFSVYLRMAEGKVPSIYGPTADEPWT